MVNPNNNLIRTRVARFDQVRILTTKNVTYLSAPLGSKVSPAGLWSVTAIIDGNELLLAKQSALIRIPATDVLIIASYSIEKITKNFGRLSCGESEKGEKDGNESKTIDRIDRAETRSGSGNARSREDS